MSDRAVDQGKLDFLREWCGLVIQFLGALAPHGVLRQLERAVAVSWERADETGLAAICEDLTAWASALGGSQQRELDTMLRLRTGIGLAEAASRFEAGQTPAVAVPEPRG